MEKDIKVLEDLEKRIKNDIFFEYPKDVYSKAIENLINRNKELETGLNNAISEQTKLTRENTKLRKEKFDLEKENQSYRDYFGTPPCYDNADYIPKSKVREKIEQDTYTNEHTILGGRRNGKTLEYGIRLGRIQMCEELLQEGDK